MSRSAKLLALTLALTPLAREARGAAQVYYTTGWPGENVIYGCPVTYSVRNLSGHPRSFTWEYRGECVTKFIPTTATNTGPSEYVYEVFPGTFEVRCTITYYPTSGGFTPKTETPSVTITIPPPDAVEVTSGNGVEVPIGTDIPIVFTILCKKKPVCTAIGLAQERISNRVWPSGPVTTESTWIPPAPHPRFYRYQWQIIDLKGWHPRRRPTFSDGWFEAADQELRLLIPDPCGTPVPYPLGRVRVTWVKDSDTTYHIDHE